MTILLKLILNELSALVPGLIGVAIVQAALDIHDAIVGKPGVVLMSLMSFVSGAERRRRRLYVPSCETPGR